MRPLYDALFDMMDRERTDELMERGVIEIRPACYMRGRTLSDASWCSTRPKIPRPSR